MLLRSAISVFQNLLFLAQVLATPRPVTRSGIVIRNQLVVGLASDASARALSNSSRSAVKLDKGMGNQGYLASS